jgi:hypothetical protein
MTPIELQSAGELQQTTGLGRVHPTALNPAMTSHPAHRIAYDRAAHRVCKSRASCELVVAATRDIRSPAVVSRRNGKPPK